MKVICVLGFKVWVGSGDSGNDVFCMDVYNLARVVGLIDELVATDVKVFRVAAQI